MFFGGYRIIFQNFCFKSINTGRPRFFQVISDRFGGAGYGVLVNNKRYNNPFTNSTFFDIAGDDSILWKNSQPVLLNYVNTSSYMCDGCYLLCLGGRHAFCHPKFELFSCNHLGKCTLKPKLKLPGIWSNSFYWICLRLTSVKASSLCYIAYIQQK